MIKIETENKETQRAIMRLIKALYKEYKRKGYGQEYTERRIIHIWIGDREYD